MGMCPILAPST